MFKNALIFRIADSWVPPSLQAIEEALALSAFDECGPTQRESHGWTPPRGEQHGALVESIGGQLIMKLMIETKVLPPSVVKKEVDKRCDKLKAERGSQRIGKLEKREIAGLVEAELLPMAFTKTGATTLWINPVARFMVVDAASMSKADRIITALVKAMADVGCDFSVRELHTATSPAAAMSTWLMEQEPPVGFSVDRECELRSSDESKAVVRYARHALDIEEIINHIKQGKLPTNLAMTFDERVSFVLSDTMTLKKIEILGVALKDSDSKDSGFDADVAISTGELSKLIPAVIEALDGEVVIGQGEDAAVGSADAAGGTGQTPGAGGLAEGTEGVASVTGGATAPWEQEAAEEFA